MSKTWDDVLVPSDRAIVREGECTHPEIAVLPTLFAHPGELGYQCTTCKKKVVIPMSTLMHQGFNDENITGIIGLAFGEKWQQQLSHKK